MLMSIVFPLPRNPDADVEHQDPMRGNAAAAAAASSSRRKRLRQQQEDAASRNQRNGLVSVTFTGTTPGSNAGASSDAESPHHLSPILRDLQLVTKKAKFQNCLPIKFVAIHACVPNSAVVRVITPIVRPMLSFHKSSRIRIHSGTFFVLLVEVTLLIHI